MILTDLARRPLAPPTATRLREGRSDGKPFLCWDALDPPQRRRWEQASRGPPTPGPVRTWRESVGGRDGRRRPVIPDNPGSPSGPWASPPGSDGPPSPNPTSPRAYAKWTWRVAHRRRSSSGLLDNYQISVTDDMVLPDTVRVRVDPAC